MTPLVAVHQLHKRYRLAGHSASGRRPWWPATKHAAPGTRYDTHSYLHAVDDVSFTIWDGDSLGLVGESGCGKSTLVRLLARLIDPTSGSIVFAGTDIAAVSARRFSHAPERSQIQVVFQDADGSLNPRFTAFHCIAEPLRRLARLSSRQALDIRVHELAELVGLPAELLGRFPHQLSGGQKARINIARAIAVQPRLLILDEPTSALDVSVQARILHLLADLRRTLGMTYLFVSHDLNVVHLLCDRVMVMYLGKIAEIGAAPDIFQHPLHPYTQALVSAIPRPGQPCRTEPIFLTGEPQSPIDPDPRVCRFYGRCPQGQDECRHTMPSLEQFRQGHLAACHYPALS